MNSRSQVGDRILQRRAALRLSQRDLAEPGISTAYISRIENGGRTPSLRALRKLAPKLGTTAHWLETGEDDPLLILANAVLTQEHRLPEQTVELAREVVKSYEHGSGTS